MAERLQSKHGFPSLNDKLFIVDVVFPPHTANVVQDDGTVKEEEQQYRWTEIIPAETEDDAIRLVRDYYKNKKWMSDATIDNPRPFKPIFDGNSKYVFPDGQISDMYVSHCKGGGINLHVFERGSYEQCDNCGGKKNRIIVPEHQSRLTAYVTVARAEYGVVSNQQELCSSAAYCAVVQSDG